MDSHPHCGVPHIGELQTASALNKLCLEPTTGSLQVDISAKVGYSPKKRQGYRDIVGDSGIVCDILGYLDVVEHDGQ